MLRHQLKHQWCWEKDRLTDVQKQHYQEWLRQAEKLSHHSATPEERTTFIKEVNRKLTLDLSTRKNSSLIKEGLELTVVVLGVVMGARALFLQPFKIPTGSMQPTLHGINFIPSAEASDVSIFRRIFNYANYSRRYVDIVIQEDGFLPIKRNKNGGPEMGGIRKRNPFFFFPYSLVTIGNVTYKLPGLPENVSAYIRRGKNLKITLDGQRYYAFKQGEILARGYLELGDHLFVNRLRFNFFEPKRGDITVFVTDGITDFFNQPLRGRFFIKRLVGLPGDVLKISRRKLYVKEKGQDTFSLVDGAYDQAFERIYSDKGGYRGYSHPRHSACQYLRNDEETFALGDDEYFMLGDNTENSQDSRFWGVVPRKNIIGIANFVYWPFSRRWSFPDTVVPEVFSSFPTEGQ